jgi:ABC transporter substrate binding protein
MRRRQFITLLGSAAAWPLAARAQQPAMPVVGFLSPLELGSGGHLLDAFRRGLAETGNVEGQNVAIEYRLAGDRRDRFPELAADLVRRQVSAIAASGSGAAVAAKAATQTLPIAFSVPEDPVKLGLVASLARPGSNATGINFFTAEVNAKRLGLLRELVPAAVRVAMLMNPSNTINTSSTLAEVEPAARGMGLQIQIFNASTSRGDGLSPQGITVDCNRKRLREVRICFTRDLKFRDCSRSAQRACRSERLIRFGLDPQAVRLRGGLGAGVLGLRLGSREGHKNIQHTVRYTEMAPDRFKDFWRG